MANVKISELPVASTVNDADVVVINQGGTTKQAARSLVKGAGTVTSVTGGTGLTGGTITGSGTLAVSYGTTAGTAAQGNDSRLSDARTPTGSAGGDLTGTYPNPTLAAITTAQSGVGSSSAIPVLSVDAKGRVTALSTVAFAGLTTSQIAGLATTAPAALATAPVAGLSTFAARADHQHVLPSLGELGAQAALTTSAPLALSLGGTGQVTRQAAMDALAGATTAGFYLRGDGTDVVMSAIQAGDLTGAVAVANGGTGQTSYTNGQLLIGNSTGNTLTKSTLTAAGNISITNGNGSISIGSTAGVYYDFFEHFLSSTAPFLGNISTSNSGGTIASSGVYTSKIGVVNLSTGAAATADQRAAINNAPTAISVGGSNIDYYIAASLAQSSSGWFTGTSTGYFRIGLLSVVAQTGIAEPVSGVYFRATNSNLIEFVTRNGGVETATSTGISFVNGTFYKFEILINSASTQVIARIDGATVATHTTNIPVAANRLGLIASLQRVTADTNSYSVALDWLYFRATPTAAWI